MYGPDYQVQHYQTPGEGAASELDGELTDAARDAAARKPGGVLLDVGCGSGRFLLAARELGLRVEGFEPVQATAKRTHEQTGLTIHSGSLANLPMAAYDVVHLADVLEHLAQPVETLKEITRLLRPDGIVIARGPLEAQPHLFLACVRIQRRIRNRLKPRDVTIPPWHVTQFTLRGWRTLLSRGGLRVIKETVCEIRWPAPVLPDGSIVSQLKSASMALSHSVLGRRLAMGNRVVSLATLA
jgi:SAM-dependent methyltransferase